MIINRDGNITLITQEKASVEKLVTTIEETYDNYKNYHLIIQLSSLETILKTDIIEFLRLSNNHRAAKKSFVVITTQLDLDELPEEIIVVPTVEEAYDIIEMEDIERDLGF